MSIRLKLTIMFLAIAVIPLLFVSILTFHNYKNSIEDSHLLNLQNIAAFKADKIETYFAGLKANMEITQNSYIVRKYLPVLIQTAGDRANPESVAAQKTLNEVLTKTAPISGVSDIMLTNPEGQVVYAIKPGHYTKNLFTSPSDVERKAFMGGKERVYFSDAYFDKAEDNRFEMLVTAPASDFNGASIGVIAFEVDMTSIYKLIQDRTGLGQTGETLIGKKVGNKIVFLSPLRYDPNAALARSVNIGDKIGIGVQKATQGTGVGQYLDYRGEKVVGAWRYIPSLGWGLVAKIDTKEAFEDITNLRNLVMLILAIVFVLSGTMAFSIAHSFSEPVKRLSKGAEIIGGGNLDYKVGTNLKDEIGQLSRAFDKMTSDLKHTLASRDELNREIEERKQTEEALRQSEERERERAGELAALLDSVPTPVFIAHDPDCRHITGNRAADELLRNPHGGEASLGAPIDMRPRHFRAFKDDRELPVEELPSQRAARGERVEGMEFSLVFDDGTVREVVGYGVPLQSADGQPRGSILALTDITDRKQAEEVVRKSRDELEIRVKERTAELNKTVVLLQNEAKERKAAEDIISAERKRFFDVLETLPMMVCLLTADHHVAFANRAFKDRFGEDNGRHCFDYRFGKTQPCDFCQSYKVLETGKPHHWEVTTPDGKNIIAAYDFPFTDANCSSMILEVDIDITEQRRAEQMLKAERKRFEDVLEMLPAYAVLLTPDYHVAYANRTFRDWFGEDNGQKCYEFLFGRSEPCENCQTYNVMKTGKSQFWEWTGPNGKNYDIYDYPFIDVDGSPLIMEIGVDVTAHKQAQKAVKQGEERYRSLTEATSQIVWTTDAQGQVIGDMPSWRAFTGLTIEEIRGWGWINSLHPDDREHTAKIWTKSVQSKTLYETEYRLRRRDGEYRYMSVRGVPVLEQKDGSTREWIGTCTDITEQKRAQEALRSTSLYTRGLIEASLDPLVTINPDGKITDVNEAAVKVTGVVREQLIGTDFSSYFTEPQKAREGYRKVFDEGFVTDYPLTIRHRDGRLTDVLYNATIYKDSYGNVSGVFAAARDVTVQKQASRYARGLLESSLDPLVTISADGKITDVNEAAVNVTGVAREQLIGTDFSSYFTEPEKAEEGYRKVFDEGFVTDYPLTIRHRDGQLTDVLYNATIYKDSHGNVSGVFAAARDVTERKRIERRENVIKSLLELFAREISRKAYLDSAVELIRKWSSCEFAGIRIRDDGNIPYESYVGFKDEFIALENALHLERDSCICVRTILEKPQEQERKYVSGDGSFYCNDTEAFLKELDEEQKKNYRGNCIKWGFKSISVIPIRYRNKVLGVIHLADFKIDKVALPKVQFIETTVAPLIGEAVQRFNVETELDKYRQHLEEEVKQRTGELSRSNKDLEQFAYVASHDLQEPLRAVGGFVGLLKMQLENSLDAKKLEYMNFITDGVTRMQVLIQALLEYSRIGTRGEAPERVDSQTALNNAIANLRTSIRENGAKITSGDLPTVYFDATQLMQLFQNLIGNAIKFRGESAPRIHVSAVRDNNAWRFAVADNGIGIEPQYNERIFQIFQRLHTRGKYPGTGIGLSICKKIVERHNGKIWVESKQGSGSTFYFTIKDEGEI